MEQTKKSLCCGADVVLGNASGLFRTNYYVCESCNGACDLQKNSDLTLAEVYAVRDDVISFKDDYNDTWSEQMLNLGWTNAQWLTGRFSITDRKSWHKHEKQEAKAEPSETNSIKSNTGITFKDGRHYLNGICFEDLQAEIADLNRKSEWQKFPENKPKSEGRILVKDSCNNIAVLFYKACRERFEPLDSVFDITSQVKFFKEIE